jgi:hypothetical protein
LLEQSTCSHVQVPNYANANYFLVASLCRLNLQQRSIWSPSLGPNHLFL